MPQLYTEVFVLKITKTQKETLEKLKSKNYKVSDFVRCAIYEKLQREKHEIIKQKDVFCPF